MLFLDVAGVTSDEKQKSGDEELKDFVVVESSDVPEEVKDDEKKLSTEDVKDLVLEETEDSRINQLKRLIRIISNSPEDYLNQEIESDKMGINLKAGVPYQAILTRLIDLSHDWNEKKPENSYMEDLLFDWANENDMDKIDNEVLEEIRICSVLLTEWLENIKSQLSK